MAHVSRMTRGRVVAYLMVLLVATLGAFPAAAQFTTASLGGTITDPTGAAIAAAGIIVRNTATGVTYSTTSQTSGEYKFPALPVGTYELTVTKSGFETYVQTGIVLTVNEAATQAVVLKVGQVTERVTVYRQTPRW